MTQKLVINCETGEQEYIDLTPEEEAEILVRQMEASEFEIEEQLRNLDIAFS
jgi:hypothetical protein